MPAPPSPTERREALLRRAREATEMAEKLRAAGQVPGALAAAAVAAQYLALVRLFEARP